MSKNVDRRGKLKGEPFQYRVTKDGRALISWQGRMIVTLSGRRAEGFLAEIADKDEFAVQLALAKATGNFKHGNEKGLKRG